MEHLLNLVNFFWEGHTYIKIFYFSDPHQKWVRFTCKKKLSLYYVSLIKNATSSPKLRNDIMSYTFYEQSNIMNFVRNTQKHCPILFKAWQSELENSIWFNIHCKIHNIIMKWSKQLCYIEYSSYSVTENYVKKYIALWRLDSPCTK